MKPYLHVSLKVSEQYMSIIKTSGWILAYICVQNNNQPTQISTFISDTR